MRIKLIKQWHGANGNPGDIVEVDDEELALSAIERGIAEVIEEKVVKVADTPKAGMKKARR